MIIPTFNLISLAELIGDFLTLLSTWAIEYPRAIWIFLPYKLHNFIDVSAILLLVDLVVDVRAIE